MADKGSHLVFSRHLALDQIAHLQGVTHQVFSNRWGFCSVFDFLGVTCHLKGRSTLLPGSVMDCSVANVARSTANCVSASPGSPTVCPKGCSIPATLGAHTAPARSGILARMFVLKPAASISRATSPTDQLQIGQLGTSTSTSTCSSFSCWIMAGDRKSVV